jgi:hypothetical protein
MVQPGLAGSPRAVFMRVFALVRLLLDADLRARVSISVVQKS